MEGLLEKVRQDVAERDLYNQSNKNEQITINLTNKKANESNRKNSSHKEMVANRVPEHQIKGFTFLLEVRLITPCSQLLDPGVVGVGELFMIGLGIIWRLDPTIRGS